MSIYKATYTRNGFFRNVGEILRPRILAEGYDLRSSDEGKDVFIRSPQGPFPEWILKAILSRLSLTISYVREPTKVEITFSWDVHDFSIKRDEHGALARWCYQQAKEFFDYLNKWFDATEAASLPES